MKKKVQKAGFLRSTTPISWKPPHTSEGKGKKEKKEREGRKQENRKIAMAGLTFSSYMMVTSIWRKFLAEKNFNCLKDEVYLAVTFLKIRVDVYFFVCFAYSWSVSKGSALATKQVEANSVFLLIQVSKLIFNLLSRRLL